MVWSQHKSLIIKLPSSPQDRVYYISESVMKASCSINKDNLLHCGTCLGKFTKSGKFRLHITALDYLAQYSKVSDVYLDGYDVWQIEWIILFTHSIANLFNATTNQYKVWLKPSAEMSFLYGNNVMKSGLARITESTPQYAGVIVYNMSDIPLGFGVAAQTTEACKELGPTANVVLHQADVGEFLRGLEDDMF